MPDLRRAGAAAGIAMLLAAAPAAADWRDDVGTVRLGMVAVHGAPYAHERLEPFRLFLEARLALPVALDIYQGYADLVRAQAAGRVDVAGHSAYSYVATVGRCGCVEPVAAPLARGGAAGFHAIVVAKAGAGIATLEDAAGRRIAVTTPDSIAGYAAPISALEAVGVKAGDIQVAAATDPADGVTMVLTGEADLAAAWSSLEGNAATGYSFGVLADLVADGLMTMDEIDIVWRSPLIPFGPVAVLSDAPAELKILLSDALLSLEGEAPGILDAVVTLPVAEGGFARIDGEAYGYMAEIAGE